MKTNSPKKKSEITKSKLMEATIDLIAEEGLENFKTKHLAIRTGLAEGNIYNYFSGKDNLINSCFESIDREVDDRLTKCRENLGGNGEKIQEALEILWKTYFGYFVEHPKETLFYHEFRHSPRYAGYVQKVRGAYNQDFLAFMDVAAEKMKIRSNNVISVVWMHIVDSTLDFVCRLIKGEIEDTEETRRWGFKLIFSGIYGVMEEAGIKISH